MDYSEIRTINIPLTCALIAFQFMRSQGLKGLEGMALFVGRKEKAVFQVTESIIPLQQSIHGDLGLGYFVEDEELYRINKWLYEKKLSLISQIHSHPREAYHSNTDDEYALVTKVGGFSIVVPNFASDPIEVDNWEVYQLQKGRQWARLDQHKRLTTFKIIR